MTRLIDEILAMEDEDVRQSLAELALRSDGDTLDCRLRLITHHFHGGLRESFINITPGPYRPNMIPTARNVEVSNELEESNICPETIPPPFPFAGANEPSELANPFAEGILRGMAGHSSPVPTGVTPMLPPSRFDQWTYGDLATGPFGLTARGSTFAGTIPATVPTVVTMATYTSQPVTTTAVASSSTWVTSTHVTPRAATILPQGRNLSVEFSAPPSCTMMPSRRPISPTPAPRRNTVTFAEEVPISQTSLLSRDSLSFSRPSTQTRNFPAIVSKWDLSYPGKGDISVEEFLARLFECASGTNMTEADLFECLPFILQGNARQWFRQNRNNWSTWPDFVVHFRRRFCGVRFQTRIRNEVLRRTQAPDEPIADYLECLQGLMSYVDPPMSEEDKLDRAYSNLHPTYLTHITSSQFSTLDELKALGVELEAARSIRQQYRPPPDTIQSLLPEFAPRVQIPQASQRSAARSTTSVAAIAPTDSEQAPVRESARRSPPKKKSKRKPKTSSPVRPAEPTAPIMSAQQGITSLEREMAEIKRQLAQIIAAQSAPRTSPSRSTGAISRPRPLMAQPITQPQQPRDRPAYDSSPRSRRVKRDQGGLVCFNCRQSGHHHSVCPETPRCFCPGCGVPSQGHSYCSRCASRNSRNARGNTRTG